MELFISNVPGSGSETHLRKVLQPHISKLSLRSWYCQKSSGKRFANLTFLHVDDAERFLRVYGQPAPFSNVRTTRLNNPRPQVSAGSLLFGAQRMYCRRSNREASQYLIRSLHLEEKNRAQQQLVLAHVAHPKEVILPISFNTHSVSCGIWSYAGPNPVYEPQLTWNINGTAKFGEHSMMLTLESGLRLDFFYFAILLIATEEGHSPSLIFSMYEAPRFFEQIKQDSLLDLMANLGLQQRQIPNLQTGLKRNRLTCLNIKHQPIAGSCLVYRVALQGEKQISHRGDSSISERMQQLRRAQGLPNTIHRQTDIRIPTETFHGAYHALQNELKNVAQGIPWQMGFQVQKLAQSGYLPPRTVIQLLPEIKRMLKRNPNALALCVESIKKLFHQINFPGPETEGSEFELPEIVALLKDNEKRCQRDGPSINDGVSASSNIAIVHRVDITPSSIRLGGPEPESNNRVLRKYPDHHEFFIRVRFCDEDSQPVRFNPRVSNEKIYHGRFKDVLKNGIEIAGRIYSFLGFSHSSLRSQSCWFMAPFFHGDTLLFYNMIIQDLGDFDIIQCPAKFAARIGQTFSDTRTAVTIKDNIERRIEDVKFGDRVFSDGVGTMSESVMKKIWEALPAKHLIKPTHFQIRYKGAKGMISLDSQLEGEVLNLRPSMTKFDGSTWPDIEICDATYKPLPVYLNRQFIKILEDMGVADSFFLNLQEKEVRRLRDVAANPMNASTFLRRQSIGDSLFLPWFINQLGFLGIDFRKDGFLRDVLEMALLTELRLLKYKTRIPVEDGWHLHGLMDETGFLEEGQVFVTGMVDGYPQVVVGKKLIVTRAPALHPGDIQIVEAVTPPPGSLLRSLTNCICFSKKGVRDLPSQLSGGDLDGDRYYIIWDNKCKPQSTFTPADYPRQKPVNIGRRVTSSDVTNFFIQFMETDQLGRIAVAHRVLSDQKTEGTLHADCITLAEMHSTAVDFSKTGIPVDMSKMPRYERSRPDFEAPGPHVKIEKDMGVMLEDDDLRDPDDFGDEDDDFTKYRYYKSMKILGKLYRDIDERETFEHIKQHAIQGVTSKSSVIESVWAHVQKKCVGFFYDHLLDWARDLRDNYEENLLSTMQEASEHPKRPITELEAFVGSILGKAGAQTRHQRELSMSMKERFDESATFIVNCMLKEGEEWSAEALEKSMACVAVSLEERPRTRKADSLMSFRYLAASVCLREVAKLPEFNSNPYGLAPLSNDHEVAKLRLAQTAAAT